MIVCIGFSYSLIFISNLLKLGMINSYFKTAVSRPSPSQNFTTNYPSNKYLEKTNIKHKKYKLFMILLTRATHRCLR